MRFGAYGRVVRWLACASAQTEVSANPRSYARREPPRIEKRCGGKNRSCLQAPPRELVADKLNGALRPRRRVEHKDGQSTYELAALKKTIYSLIDLREIMLGCNQRYLAFLSSLDDPSSCGHERVGAVSTDLAT